MDSGASSMIRVLLSAPLCLHIRLSSRFTCWPEICIVPHFVSPPPESAPMSKLTSHAITELISLAEQCEVLCPANLAKTFLPPVGTEDDWTGTGRRRDVSQVVRVSGGSPVLHYVVHWPRER